MKAYDRSGNFSAVANTLTLAMPVGTDRTPPAAPGDLRTSDAPQISTVNLAWDWPADDVGVTAFEIYRDGVLVAENAWDVHYPGVDTFITLRHVLAGMTHTFTVKARDASGNVSAASNVLSVALMPATDTLPPSAPTHLTGSTWPSCGFIDLNRGASIDDVDGAGWIDYEIYEDGLLRGYYRGEAFEASFGRHTFHVRGVDRSGNTSAPSNSIVLDSGLDC